MFKAKDEISADVSAVEAFLQPRDPGSMVLYKTLSELIGRNVQAAGRYALQRAVKRLLDDEGAVWVAVSGQGVKRLTDSEIVALGPSYSGRIRRAARRGVRKLMAVQDFDKLTPAERMRHNALVAGLGAIHEMSKSRNLVKLEQLAGSTQVRLPLAKTLDAFKK